MHAGVALCVEPHVQHGLELELLDVRERLLALFDSSDDVHHLHSGSLLHQRAHVYHRIELHLHELRGGLSPERQRHSMRALHRHQRLRHAGNLLDGRELAVRPVPVR
jgi:hypothetical protein